MEDWGVFHVTSNYCGRAMLKGYVLPASTLKDMLWTPVDCIISRMKVLQLYE